MISGEIKRILGPEVSRIKSLTNYLHKQFPEGETNGESTATPVTQLKESNLSSIAANSSSPEEYFEFKSNRARAIFDYLVKSFSLDYMTKRLARDDSGWRSLGEVVQDLQILDVDRLFEEEKPVQPACPRAFAPRLCRKKVLPREERKRWRNNEIEESLTRMT